MLDCKRIALKASVQWLQVHIEFPRRYQVWELSDMKRLHRWLGKAIEEIEARYDSDDKRRAKRGGPPRPRL